MDEQVIIKSDKLTATFSKVGAELISLKNTNGKEYIWQGNNAFWAGHCPILFPICGGLKDDKFIYENKEYTLLKHGFARKVLFEVDKQTENFVVFSLEYDENTLKQYPFKFKFVVEYTLQANKLQVKYKVENLDDKPLLYSVGGHEGYALSGNFEDYALVFEKKENLNSYQLVGNLLDYNYINVGLNTDTLNLNYDYFSIDALSFLDLKSRKVKLVNTKTNESLVSVDYEGFDTLFLWTKPNAKYICIEPWAGMPDRTDSDGVLEHKQGIMKIEKSESKIVSHTIEFF